MSRLRNDKDAIDIVYGLRSLTKEEAKFRRKFLRDTGGYRLLGLAQWEKIDARILERFGEIQTWQEFMDLWRRLSVPGLYLGSNSNRFLESKLTALSAPYGILREFRQSSQLDSRQRLLPKETWRARFSKGILKFLRCGH